MNKLKFRGCYIERGFTQNSLANVMGMTVQTFIRKQSNDSFTIKEIERLCEILNLSARERENIFFNVEMSD